MCGKFAKEVNLKENGTVMEGEDGGLRGRGGGPGLDTIGSLVSRNVEAPIAEGFFICHLVITRKQKSKT